MGLKLKFSILQRFVQDLLGNFAMGGINSQGIPKEIIEYPQWIVWKGEPKKNGKMDRVPYSPITDKKASVKDPSTWSSFEDALSRYEAGGFSGIGFVFTQNDPYCGIDVDSCRNPETGIIEPWAQREIENFQSYTEISPSGTGVHIITKGELPEGGRKKGNIEIYDKGRFFTFTGNHLD
jgi:primase-polymerase (primpol)-like protein